MESLLSEAESLLLSALQISTNSLGECNSYTVWLYTNLGLVYKVKSESFSGDPLSISIFRFAMFSRISFYSFFCVQEMKRFQEAERMYLKSLQITESVHGTEAYEVNII